MCAAPPAHRPCTAPDPDPNPNPNQVIDRNVKKAMDPTTAASKELMCAATLALSLSLSLSLKPEP